MEPIREGVSEYIEAINSVEDLKNHKGGRILYHRTGYGVQRSQFDNLLNNIRQCGMAREFQSIQAYGYGLYCSLRLSDCIHNTSYGPIIIKQWVPGFDRCLIDEGCDVYGKDLAELVHGRNCDMDSQIRKLFKPEYQGKFRDVTSVRIFQNKSMEPILQENDIDGIIYDWFRGHWVCVWKDYKKVFPLEYSIDDGKTFHPLGNENTVKNVLKTWEPDRVLGTDIVKYNNAANSRVVNGYLKVNNNNGYNFINPTEGKNPLSATWFENASDADENGVATIKFNGQKFWYYLPDDEIYEIDGDDTEEALMMNDPIGNSKDLPMITAKQAMEEDKGVFGNLLNEAIDEYVPGADRDTIHDRNTNGLVCFYRLSLPNQIKSIEANGFTKEFRGTGNDNTDWIGSGTYGCVEPHWRTGVYGSILWAYGTPAQLVADTYISPDPYLAKKFGIQGTFAEQLERFFPDLVPIWKQRGIWRQIAAPGYSGSHTIRKMNEIAFDGGNGRSDHFYHSHGINGIIYHGNMDGDAVLTFDDSTIIPLAWRDNSQRGSEWHKVNIGDTLWDRTFNGYDPLPFLKGTYKDYANTPNEISQNYRVINGYMKVCRKADGKCNYVKAPEGGRNFASSVWFDNATDLDQNGVGLIKFNGQKFWYYAADDEIYEIDGDDTEEALMMNDPIGNSKDLPMITAKQAMEESNTVFGRLLNEAMQQQRKEIDNFNKIAHFLNTTNPDDFYFVQIIRRKKDNPTAKFHYAEYPKSWDVHNGDELMAIKDEIKRLCTLYNARAYIRLNPRSHRLTDANAAQLIRKSLKTNQSLNMEIAHAMAAGHSFKTKAHTHDFPVSMIDIDSTDKNLQQQVLDQLKQNNIQVLFTYETLNGGMHIVMPNREACKLDFTWADGGRNLGMTATVGVDCDAATLLYSNLIPLGYL